MGHGNTNISRLKLTTTAMTIMKECALHERVPGLLWSCVDYDL